VQPTVRTGQQADGLPRDLIGITVRGVVRTENIVAGTGIDGATLENVGFVRLSSGVAVILQLADGDSVIDENGSNWPVQQFTARVTTPYGASNTTHAFFGVELAYDNSGTPATRAAIVSVNKVNRAVRFTLLAETTPNTVQVLGLDLARAPETWGTAARASACRFAFAPPAPVFFTAQHLMLIVREDASEISMRRMGVVYTSSGVEPVLDRLEAQEAALVDNIPFAVATTERLPLTNSGAYNLAYCEVLQQGFNDSLVTVFSLPNIQTLAGTPASDRPLAMVTDAVTGVQPTGVGISLNIAANQACTAVHGVRYPQRAGVVAVFGNCAPGGTAASISPTVWLFNAFTEQLEASAYANGVLIASALVGTECITGCAGVNAYSTDGFAIVVVRFANTPEFPEVWRLSNAVDAAPLNTLAPLRASQADVRATYMVQGSTGGTLVGDISFQQSALKAPTPAPNSVLSVSVAQDFTRRMISAPVFLNNCSARLQQGLEFPTQRVAEFTSADAGAANVVVLNGVVQLGGSAGVSDPAAGMLRWNGANVQVYNGSAWTNL